MSEHRLQLEQILRAEEALADELRREAELPIPPAVPVLFVLKRSPYMDAADEVRAWWLKRYPGKRVTYAEVKVLERRIRAMAKERG